MIDLFGALPEKNKELEENAGRYLATVHLINVYLRYVT
jgi:hypothetical protein